MQTPLFLSYLKKVIREKNLIQLFSLVKRQKVLKIQNSISKLQQLKRRMDKISWNEQTDLFLLAVDGLEWRLLNKYCHDGKLPNFAKAIKQGAIGKINLPKDLQKCLSPIIWTSISTGKHYIKHGIVDVVDSEGMPVTSNMIKAKRIWHILSEKRIPCGILGWIVEYPPPEIFGYFVSERLSREDCCYPPEIRLLLQEIKGEKKQIRRFSPFLFEENYKEKFEENSGPWMKNHLFHNRLLLGYKRDEAFRRLGMTLFKRYKPALCAIYLRGIDFVSHAFWRYTFPEEFDKSSKFHGISMADRTNFGSIIENYYIYIDQILGQAMKFFTSRMTLLILSDHGFQRIKEGDIKENGNIWYRFLSGFHYVDNPGVLIMYGDKVKHSLEMINASIFDITPTILNILDLPVARDMDGRPLVEAFKKPNRVRYIDTYETGPIGEDKAIVTDDTKGIIEQLRSLGYID